MAAAALDGQREPTRWEGFKQGASDLWNFNVKWCGIPLLITLIGASLIIGYSIDLGCADHHGMMNRFWEQLDDSKTGEVTCASLSFIAYIMGFIALRFKKQIDQFQEQQRLMAQMAAYGALAAEPAEPAQPAVRIIPVDAEPEVAPAAPFEAEMARLGNAPS